MAPAPKGLYAELIRTRDVFASEVSQVLTYIKNSQTSLKRREARLKLRDLDAKEVAEMKKIQAFLKDFIDGKPNAPNTIRLHSSRVGEWMFPKSDPRKQAAFLGEMSLSYLISFQEAFLKDYLLAILVSRRETLKSNKVLTYETVCEHRSMTSLVRELANKEVDSLGESSIDDFAKFFHKKFNIALSDFEEWDQLRESTYRRNIIVHNRGFTNERYCKATGYKERNKHLSSDITYSRNAGEVLLKFMDFVHEQMLAKLKLTPPRRQKPKRGRNATPNGSRTA